MRTSIVVPTFNRCELLPHTLKSCLDQTIECEIIVCDHGSTDQTAQVVAGYGDRIRYIRNDTDFGPHFCWLDGVIHASGDYVHLQYDDDLIEPTFIEKTLALMSNSVGFCFTSAIVFEGESSEQHVFSDIFDESIISAKKAEKFVLANLLSPACLLLRKQDLIDALYQGRLPLQKNDYHGVGPDYWATLLCLLRYENIGYVNEPLARFRAHSGSITIDANAEASKQAQLKMAYDEVRRFYKHMKLLRNPRLCAMMQKVAR